MDLHATIWDEKGNIEMLKMLKGKVMEQRALVEHMRQSDLAFVVGAENDFEPLYQALMANEGQTIRQAFGGLVKIVNVIGRVCANS